MPKIPRLLLRLLDYQRLVVVALLQDYRSLAVVALLHRHHLEMVVLSLPHRHHLVGNRAVLVHHRLLRVVVLPGLLHHLAKRVLNL
jgi:hypothetical protein